MPYVQWRLAATTRRLSSRLVCRMGVSYRNGMSTIAIKDALNTHGVESVNRSPGSDAHVDSFLNKQQWPHLSLWWQQTHLQP
jgi:hypothetical protein